MIQYRMLETSISFWRTLCISIRFPDFSISLQNSAELSKIINKECNHFHQILINCEILLTFRKIGITFF